MNSTYSTLSAAELNEAIDSTNFPCSLNNNTTKNLNNNIIESFGKMNGHGSNASNATTSSINSINGKPKTDDDKNKNGESLNGIAKVSANDDFDDGSPSAVSNPVLMKNLSRPDRPTPLKIVSFTESLLLDIPGTPKTPRTSTTPGVCK